MIKRHYKLISLVFVIFLMLSGFKNDTNNVYVIPINGEINKASSKFVEESLNRINLLEDDVVIFEIDTYGGLVDEAIKIKDLIINLPNKSVAYINNKAISAGVLISIAANEIYMAENANIGSAETIPNDEKVLSMWRGVLRDTAQYRNRDALIVEAMADKDIVIENIIVKDKLLNLTSKEALKINFIDGIAANYSELLTKLNIDKEVVNVSENFEVKLAKYISLPLISSILISAAFIGLIIEIMSPGFGIGGIVSIVSFGLYFSANIFAGYANLIALILFIIGVIFIGVALLMPGFGVPEILSVFFIFSGIIMANYSFNSALIAISIAVLISSVLVFILLKIGVKSKHLEKIILNNKLNEDSGFLASDIREDLLFKEGVSVSELRPSGIILIDDKHIDVLSLDGLIEKNVVVRVEKIEGFKVFVRRK